MSLTKDSGFLLHATDSPFYWRILLFSGPKNPYKQIREKRKFESIHE